MVTGDQKDVSYCFPWTSIRKEKKSSSTSQPQFLSENTLAPIEADHILLAFQQVASINKIHQHQQQHQQNFRTA